MLLCLAVLNQASKALAGLAYLRLKDVAPMVDIITVGDGADVTAEDVRPVLELPLREAGVLQSPEQTRTGVKTAEDAKRALLSPVIALDIEEAHGQGALTAEYFMELRVECFFGKGGVGDSLRGELILWDDVRFGMAPTSVVAGDIEDRIKGAAISLANDYLRVNPKSRSAR